MPRRWPPCWAWAPIAAAIWIEGSGHLHPLNLALGLARAAESGGVQVFEDRWCTDYRRGPGPFGRIDVRTGAGEVDAGYLVLACNGYLGRLARGIESYQMPINNFVLATEPWG